MSVKSICILTQSHLCRNPRVLKEAITLAKNGYDVKILNSIYSKDLLRQDLLSIKNYNVEIIHIIDLTQKSLGVIIDRAFYKLGRSLIKYYNIESSLALGYGLSKYYKIAHRINADLYICHQELATYTGNKLIKAGFKVAFDIEDWYSEDLLPPARLERPVNLLKKNERLALTHGLFCITTSDALAKKLSETYLSKLPYTIYNAFPSQNNLLNKQKEFSNPLKLFWFSQTIGPGRGLEQFIVLSNSLKNKFELHLLGNIDTSYQESLETLMPTQHQLYFHEIVEEQKLAEKIASFDIGLALELAAPLSRNYTITNKFFQYLQAGLPIITSETQGQNEGFEKFKPGFKLSQNPSEKEIKKLEEWLNNPIELESAKQKAIEAANFYNWENESKKLINLVKQALNLVR